MNNKKKVNIFLIGFMGAGKSTVAREISALTQSPVIEMDSVIVERQGMPVTEIFEKHGEPYFRSLETALLEELGDGGPYVVSCGGGVPMRSENVSVMRKSGKIVLLAASPETIYDRVKNSTDRPILNGHMEVSYISDLMEKRRPAYEAAADVTVRTDGKSVREIAEEILRKV